jgi:hypothetical protein
MTTPVEALEKRRALARQRGRCPFCGVVARESETVLEEADGAARAVCRDCARVKGDLSDAELTDWLRTAGFLTCGE